MIIFMGVYKGSTSQNTIYLHYPAIMDRTDIHWEQGVHTDEKPIGLKHW